MKGSICPCQSFNPSVQFTTATRPYAAFCFMQLRGPTVHKDGTFIRNGAPHHRLPKQAKAQQGRQRQGRRKAAAPAVAALG